MRAARARAGAARRAATGRSARRPRPGSAGTPPTASATGARAPSATRSAPTSRSRSEDFLRAAEALTGAPITDGNRAELLINGDRIFPAFLETIASAERTLNVQTYVYWRGDIADEVAAAIREQGPRRGRAAR